MPARPLRVPGCQRSARTSAGRRASPGSHRQDTWPVCDVRESGLAGPPGTVHLRLSARTGRPAAQAGVLFRTGPSRPPPCPGAGRRPRGNNDVNVRSLSLSQQRPHGHVVSEGLAAARAGTSVRPGADRPASRQPVNAGSAPFGVQRVPGRTAAEGMLRVRYQTMTSVDRRFSTSLACRWSSPHSRFCRSGASQGERL
jgi:hypothetical protein